MTRSDKFIAQSRTFLDALTRKAHASRTIQSTRSNTKRTTVHTVLAAGLATCALAISFCTNAQATTETGGALTSVAPPPNSKPLARHALSAGGRQATYMTSATPGGVISFYKQLLPAAGWTVTGSDTGDGSRSKGARLQATNGPQYLALNAVRPTGKTYVKICIWPSRPSDDGCD
jgi:hypothetical protein